MGIQGNRLELTWVGKDQRPKLEPRILIEEPERGHSTNGPAASLDNRLIFGDNLLALKALEQEFTGKVKCVFIDPPYNTGSAFTHYDDGLEHSIWLSLMRDRLEIIRRLLSDDGSLWITIDDNEAHYLKVLCDEVFGRRNFVANVVWEKKFSPQNDAKWISLNHDHLLVIAKEKSTWRPNLLARSEKQKKNFKNPDGDLRGLWTSADYTCAKNKTERPNLFYPIVNPNTSEEVWPNPLRVWAFDRKSHERNVNEDLLWWGKDGTNPVPRLKKFATSVRAGTVPTTVWGQEDTGNNQDAKREVIAFNNTNPFSTPKPERLLKRVLEIATNPGDLVLDSFAGSGTTGAVAHKMGRRWIMIELGEHCHTHIVPRLRKVIDGEDEGGISKAMEWNGGGSFRYFRLAPSLIEYDAHGREILSKNHDERMLAEAVCKIEGFTFQPHAQHYWQHGQAGERDFIYVTRRTLFHNDLVALNDAAGSDRTLLVCCVAFHANRDSFKNLTIKKIPNVVLDRCEWGRDDYSFATDHHEPSENSANPA